jgi:urease accessory protein
MGLGMGIAMTIDQSGFLLLLNWMSPAFPTGAFAYSHGMEWAIENGDLQTAQDVEPWISDLLTSGSAWNDAVIFAQCWSGDPEPLNELALALAGSAERFLETTQLGRSFAIAASEWTGQILPDEASAFPVAAGSSCSQMGISIEFATLAFLQGFCAALVSVAVRLVPLGQTRGLQILRNLMPVIATVAERASRATLDDLGTNTIAADIASMKHETLESRIFRT